MTTSTIPDQDTINNACRKIAQWQEAHGYEKPVPRKLQGALKKVNAAWKEGHHGIIQRLADQCAETTTQLPAMSYKEAISLMEVISLWPHFAPGETSSARTRECLMPLFIDLFHLASGFAEKGDDFDADIANLVQADG